MRIAIYLATRGETPAAESPCFTEAERRFCLARANSVSSLAARYAAKRAAASALELSEEVALSEIEIAREKGRAPELRFHASVKRRAFALELTRAHLSLSHSGEYAVALVVLD